MQLLNATDEAVPRTARITAARRGTRGRRDKLKAQNAVGGGSGDALLLLTGAHCDAQRERGKAHAAP